VAFTAEEKVQIRRHLGYMNVQEAYTFVLGVPAGVETQFLIEGAMNRVLPQAEPECRRHLEILAKLEGQMIEDLDTLVADAVGDIKIRPTEMKELRREYQYWREGLANLLGIYPNPFDKRFFGAGLNVRVQH
jgi:hypothetical protein